MQHVWFRYGPKSNHFYFSLDTHNFLLELQLDLLNYCIIILISLNGTPDFLISKQPTMGDTTSTKGPHVTS